MRIEWCCCCLSVRQGVLILIVSQAFFSGVSLLNSSVARSVLLGPPSSSLTSWFAEGEVNLCFNAIAFLGALLGIYGFVQHSSLGILCYFVCTLIWYLVSAYLLFFSYVSFVLRYCHAQFCVQLLCLPLLLAVVVLVHLLAVIFACYKLFKDEQPNRTTPRVETYQYPYPPTAYPTGTAVLYPYPNNYHQQQQPPHTVVYAVPTAPALHMQPPPLVKGSAVF
eukprot:c11294_g1_i1.p1 GENE.c11294_g1_i1~~c11294_g1_i1.p1  ORF type:complete len:222 (-),score=51.84 c11294_g1_i1:153-818(-)